MAEEFNYNLQLAKERLKSEQFKEQNIEDRKDKRVRIEGTQRSQMIQQRQNDGMPIDFESNNDSCTRSLFQLNENYAALYLSTR